MFSYLNPADKPVSEREETMDQPTTKFENWAVVELFGHQREAGYVTTQYFGDKAMFQIDVPELKEREYELKSPCWIDGTLAAVGSKVKKQAKEGRSRLVNPGAVYAMNPCSEAAVLTMLEEMAPRSIKIVELAKTQQICQGEPAPREAFEVYEVEEGFAFNDPSGKLYGPYSTDESAADAADRIEEEYPL
jgi:hypothetical protein